MVKISSYSDSANLIGVCIQPEKDQKIHEVVLNDNSLVQSNMHIVPMSADEMTELAVELLQLSQIARLREKHIHN